MAKNKPDKELNKNPEEAKKFLDYQQSKPFQLSLFDLFENEKEFSHTIELYDFMPKFVWEKSNESPVYFCILLNANSSVAAKSICSPSSRRASRTQTGRKSIITRQSVRKLSKTRFAKLWLKVTAYSWTVKPACLLQFTDY